MIISCVPLGKTMQQVFLPLPRALQQQREEQADKTMVVSQSKAPTGSQLAEDVSAVKMSECVNSSLEKSWCFCFLSTSLCCSKIVYMTAF